MADGIVFISHNEVRAGGLDGLRRLSVEVFRQIEDDRPGTAAFIGFLNAEETAVTFVHVFPNARAFEAHLEGADERSAEAYRYMEPRAIEIYGPASAAALTAFRDLAGAGVQVTVQPVSLGGFIRQSTEG